MEVLQENDVKITPIAKDARGESYSITLPDNREIVLIFSKKGALRGGHSHSKDEVSMLLTGGVHYWKKNNYGEEFELDEKPGDVLFNEAGEVHLAKFEEDSWLLDWKIDTKIGECVTTNDPLYRARVDTQ